MVGWKESSNVSRRNQSLYGSQRLASQCCLWRKVVYSLPGKGISSNEAC